MTTFQIRHLSVKNIPIFQLSGKGSYINDFLAEEGGDFMILLMEGDTLKGEGRGFQFIVNISVYNNYNVFPSIKLTFIVQKYQEVLLIYVFSNYSYTSIT